MSERKSGRFSDLGRGLQHSTPDSPTPAATTPADLPTAPANTPPTVTTPEVHTPMSATVITSPASSPHPARPADPSEPVTESFSTRLSRDTKRRLKVASGLEDRTVIQILEEAIGDYMRIHHPELLTLKP